MSPPVALFSKLSMLPLASKEPASPEPVEFQGNKAGTWLLTKWEVFPQARHWGMLDILSFVLSLYYLPIK
jgi:hypothetical protein